MSQRDGSAYTDAPEGQPTKWVEGDPKRGPQPSTFVLAARDFACTASGLIEVKAQAERDLAIQGARDEREAFYAAHPPKAQDAELGPRGAMPRLDELPLMQDQAEKLWATAGGMPKLALPTDANERKSIPLARGLLDYFPAALAAVAVVSRIGNEQHNPGQPMHHARGKSTDHADCIIRHLMDRGTIDPADGQLHSAKVAWRALAMLQEELEAHGAPLARGAKL